MTTNNSSVRFDAREAERSVNSYAGKINNLNSRLKEAKNEARAFGTATQSSGNKLTEASRKAHTSVNAFKSLGQAVKAAAREFGSFGSKINTGELARAAGVIKGMAGHLTVTSGRLRQMRTHLTSVNKMLGTFATRLDQVGRNVRAMGIRLAAAIPQLQKAAAVIMQLNGAMARGTNYRVAIRGLEQTGRASRGAASGVSALSGAMRAGTASAKSYNMAIGAGVAELYGMGVAAVRARNLLFYLAGGFGVTQVIQAADSYKLMRGRLANVTEGAEELNTVYNSLLASSNMTRTGLSDNVNSYTRLKVSGEAYNISAAETLRMVENVNMALTLGGASAGEAASATQQLSQAFSSGRIQGDELRSVLENSSILSRALNDNLKDLGITSANLRDKAAEGAIGIRELQKAFTGKEFTDKLLKQMKEFPITVGQAMQIAGNNLTDYIGRVDAAGGYTDKLSKAIIWLSGNMDTLGPAIAAVAGIILASYIPAILRATNITKTLALLNLASYGLGLKKVFSAAGQSVGLFSGVLKKSATSTAPHWVQAMRNIGAASSLSMGSILTAARTVFTRVPILAAVAAVGMKTFGNDTKATADGIATVSDYAISTLSFLFNKFVGFLKGVFSAIDTAFGWVVDSIMWGINQIYRGFKGLFSMASGVAKNLMSGQPMIMAIANSNMAGDFSKGYNSGGLGDDIISGLSGVKEIREGAESRARARQNRQNQKIEGDGVYNPNAGTIGGGTEDKGGGKGGKDKAAKEAEQLANELKSLINSLDKVENSRNEFNEGVTTLTASMKAGTLSAADYQKYMKLLGENVFPGLKDEIKDLKAENDKLSLENSGADEATVKFFEMSKIAQEMVSTIDTIVSKQGDSTGQLEKQKQAILDQLDEYGNLIIANKELNDLADKRKEKEQQITQIIDNAAEKLYDSFVDRLRDTLSFSGNMLKNFFKSILSMAKDTFSQVIASLVFSEIQEDFRGVLKKAFGQSSGTIAEAGSAGSPKETLNGSTIGQVVNVIKGNAGGGGSVNIPGGGIINLPSIPDAIQNGTVPSNDNDAPNFDPQKEIVVTAKKGGKSFFGEVAKGYKGLMTQEFGALGKVFRPLGQALKPIGKLFKPLIEKMGGFGQAVGKVFGGAQLGGMVAGFGKMLGIKTSTTGGSIGGALGAATGIPGMSMIGSVVGSIVGGMLKKTKKGTVNLSSDSFGNLAQSDAVGNGGQQKAAATAMGSSFRSALRSIADTLGVDLTSGLNLGSIGMRDKTYRYDPTGSGITKTSKGAIKFKTEEEAIEYAVKEALKKGILKGLSATSDRVIKTFKDTDRAVQLVQVMEDIKKRANLIRDPVGGTFKEMEKNFQRVADMFKEMGASAEDWADLQEVMKNDFADTIKTISGNLKEFKADLVGGDRSYKSSSSRLRIAESEFSGIEAKINSGQYVDQDTFTSAGIKLQDLAREVYGSTPEFAAFQNRLLAATDKLIQNVDAEAEKYQPIIDQLVKNAEAEKAASEQTNETLDSILEALKNGTYNPLAYGTGTDGRFNF